MRVLRTGIALCFLSAVFLEAAADVPRSVQDFTRNWKFYLGDQPTAAQPGFNDSSWRTLDLPHDWSIEGIFSKDHPAGIGGGALPGGIGWYRKSFTVPAAAKGKIIAVEFDGAYRNSEVWINGNYLGKRPNGYISFGYEINRFVRFGATNVIAVKLNNAEQPNSRWYSGSGIYRNVRLVFSGPTHFTRWGTSVTTPVVSDARAVINIAAKIFVPGNELRKLYLKTTVYTQDGKEVAVKAVVITREGDTAVVQQEINVLKPELWSVSRPYLYRVRNQVLAGNEVVDDSETRAGIRSFYFDKAKGFFLNGKSMKIQGVCNHHDLGSLGSAFNRRAAERQLELLKNMGCNAIRTAHNPPDPGLLDLCDEMGFLVMDEAFDMWKKRKNRFDYHLDWDAWHLRDLEDMVLRDRNHPSVIIWSIGNEIPEQWGDASKGDTTGRTMARQLVSFLKKLDPTRPIVTANNEVNTYNNLLRSDAFDLIGYNYNHQLWNRFHERWPGKQLIVTESTSALATRGHYDLVPFDSIRRWPPAWDKPLLNGNKDFTVSAYDNVSAPWGSTHEESLKALSASDLVSGMFVWTGFDYLGEPTPYEWPAKSSYFGIIDMAGFPKDVYYLYQSVWTDRPMLHILPHWNWSGPTGGKPGDVVDVVAYYSQADEVELYLNGKSLGARRKSGDNLHVKWRVPFEAGTLQAISRRNGKDVMTTAVKTAGMPAKIILGADRSAISADGNDLSFITVKIADQEGNLIPDAGELITFKITGAGVLAGVDNGNPISHESFKASSRKAFNGLALAIVKSTPSKGLITLTASAAGLHGASITIKTQ